MEQVGQVSGVSLVPGECTALFKQVTDLVIVSVRQGKPPQPQQQCRHILCLLRLPGRSIQPQALLTQPLCPLDIAQEKGQPGGPAECPHRLRCWNARSRCQHSLQPGKPFTQRSTRRPVADQGSCQPQGYLPFLSCLLPSRLLHCPTQCGAQVVILPLQPIEPSHLLCSEQVCFGLLGQVQVIRAMHLPGCLHLLAFGKHLKSIFTNRLKHQQTPAVLHKAVLPGLE